MAEQFIPVTVVPIATRLNPDTTPVTMIEVQFTPVKEAQVRHWTCGICGRTYPQSEMSMVGGGWYCNKFKHAEDKTVQMNRKPVVQI